MRFYYTVKKQLSVHWHKHKGTPQTTSLTSSYIVFCNKKFDTTKFSKVPSYSSDNVMIFMLMDHRRNTMDTTHRTCCLLEIPNISFNREPLWCFDTN